MRSNTPPISRREILKLLSLGTGAWFFAACSPVPGENALEPETGSLLPAPTAAHEAATLQPTPSPEPTALQEITGQPALPADFTAGRLTPTKRFYKQSYNGVAKPDPLEWRLSLNGLFDNPMELSLLDLKRRPAIEVMRTLECIGNPVGGNLIGNATWKGVSVRALLEDAGIRPEVKHIQFISADDYETSITVDLAMHEESLLVYEMNGEALTVAHGFPARMLLPGVYGQKQPKWVISMRASESDRLGIWEKKGWSNTAEIKVNSRIETPRLRQMIPGGEPYFISGIAFTDTSGVTSVEVSIDDGETWMAAETLPGPGPGVWTLWFWRWDDPLPGKYVVVARASDGNGNTQMASGAFGVLDNVFPDGTSLMHNLSITVV